MPYEWVARYDRMTYFEIDPRVQNCLRHVTPFLWDSRRNYGPKADAFLKDAAQYGLRSGITLPLRSTTGENSMFGVNSSRAELPEDEALQLAVGRFASYFHEWFFHNLRSQLVVFDMPVGEGSKRELEVLALAARGHSSKRIARELGISESTANYHIASVKQGSHTAQAIAQAVQTGLIRCAIATAKSGGTDRWQLRERTQRKQGTGRRRPGIWVGR
jgi:DNA-binding CsgD family transcriptional regulator